MVTEHPKIHPEWEKNMNTCMHDNPLQFLHVHCYNNICSPEAKLPSQAFGAWFKGVLFFLPRLFMHATCSFYMVVEDPST